MFSNIVVPDVATVQRVVAKINLNHTWDSDLNISLKSMAGPNVDLSSGNGGSGDNYLNTVFDNNCMNSILSGAPPFSGCFKPEGMLPVFMGQPSNGTWTLTISDTAPGDFGTLNSWNLV